MASLARLPLGKSVRASQGASNTYIVINLPRDPVILSGSRGFPRDAVKQYGSPPVGWDFFTGFLAKTRDPVKVFTG